MLKSYDIGLVVGSAIGAFVWAADHNLVASLISASGTAVVCLVINAIEKYLRND